MRCLASSATAILTPASAYFIGRVTRVPCSVIREKRRDTCRATSGPTELHSILRQEARRRRGGWRRLLAKLDESPKLKKCGRSAASALRRDARWHWRRRRSARETALVPKPPAKRRGTCRSSRACR